MTKQTSNNSEVRAEQAAGKKYQMIKLGLDVHADTIVVVRILDNAAPQPAQKFKPAKFLQWAQSQLALAQRVHSCYEAGPFGFVLHRQLTALGIQNVVTQPVCLDERHKGVNDDKKDALALPQRLDRYVAGNSKALATVHVLRRSRSSSESRAANVNNSNGSSNVSPRKAAVCCSARATARRRTGGNPTGGKSSRAPCHLGWSCAWKSSAACSKR